MNFVAAPSTTGMSVEDEDRRDPTQPDKRQSGCLISITGTRAVIATKVSTLVKSGEPYWAVGSLIVIYGQSSRVICLVQDMVAVSLPWQSQGENVVHANVELLGEITDEADGKPHFRRGIALYPQLGSVAHRIRNNDLVAIYDLGGRKGSVIGTLAQDERVPAAVDIDGMMRKHFAVVGTTGVGKSCSVSILLRAAIEEKHKLRVIILDPHNEYSHAFRDVATTIDPNVFELPFWLFRFEEIIDVIYRGTEPPEDEVDFLRDAIMQAKEQYNSRLSAVQPNSILKKTLRADGGGVSADAPQPYRINDILALIDEMIGRLEQKYDRYSLRNLRSRLESLSNDPSYRFMFGKYAIDGLTDPVIRQLFRLNDGHKPITVLQLAGIPADVVNAAVSVLSRMAFELSTVSHGRYEILLLCEEAHRYVPADITLGFAPTRRALARIAKEGRKYGCFLGIVTQRPSELDPTILSQCSTLFAMRLANKVDQDIIRAAIPDAAAGVLDFIAALSNREAIAFGEATSTPMRLKFAFKDPSHLPRMDEESVKHAVFDIPGATFGSVDSSAAAEAFKEKFANLPLPSHSPAPLGGGSVKEPVTVPGFAPGYSPNPQPYQPRPVPEVFRPPNAMGVAQKTSAPVPPPISPMPPPAVQAQTTDWPSVTTAGSPSLNRAPQTFGKR